jgi:hypothetical protein
VWIRKANPQKVSAVPPWFGNQKDNPHKKPFELDVDEPPLLLGADIGPNPVKYALTALAACVTTSIV